MNCIRKHNVQQIDTLRLLRQSRETQGCQLSHRDNASIPQGNTSEKLENIIDT